MPWTPPRGLRRVLEGAASKVRLLSIEGSTTSKLSPANLAALCTFLFNGYGILQASKRGAFSRANLPIRDDKPYQTNQRGLNLEQSSPSIAVGARGFCFCFCLGKLPASETTKRVGPLLVHLRHQPSTSNPSTRSYRRVRGRSATTTV
eukprot:CAMPEP_0171494098 /NCGR_PEP_ID=MMETSP0958-20121227/5327_1 /TAXON_ID=87120 /ORGANISM="Aurantiochytrium limacinum, Strain ATCCMYA-1381" /LENGTH=147 /DNA_ID=CAMNT_0012027791 /DNA_START=111 /DNA_END=555 /DNA_ORIENTATION=-